MKKTLLFFIGLLLSIITYGQNKYATTTDGKTVLLKSNGNWEYVNTTTSSNSADKKILSSSRPSTSRTKIYSTPSTKYTSRRYIRGPRGGCYYINRNGGKTYVDRSMCN